MKILIMAGGSGTRLWPVSKEKDPKQNKTLIGKNTLLQQTYKRIKKGFKDSDIFLSINKRQIKEVCKQLPNIRKENIICEPAKRDTAAAIGLATMFIAQKNPKEIIATINSDHYIKNEKEFIRVLKLAGKITKDYPDHLTLIGLNPSYPETGYGYIKLNKQIKSFNGDKVYTVDSFKEKPDLKTAKKYLANWAYLWNPAYFVFSVSTMLNLYKKHLPGQHRILMNIKKTPTALNKEFLRIKPISIDYGIMEKTEKLLCLPANFDWADVGHWRTVKDILSKKDGENVIKGKYLGLDSKNNLVYSYSNKLIATIGLKNMIIIETNDAVLICPKDRAQDVKKLVAKLKKQGLNKYL